MSYNNNPDKLCGTYFASHFNNWYVTAPIKKVYAYLDELASWGQNALMVWYDMHDYSEVDDPASVAMINRLRKITAHAKSLGMKIAFVALSNESYNDTTDDIRAEWNIQNGYRSEPTGHYHVEICPNKAGGLENIIAHRRAMLYAFKETGFDYLVICGYDQGGCTCSKCAPWGVNGNIKCIEAISELMDEICPMAEIILSTWRFDDFIGGELDGLYDAIDRLSDSTAEKISYIMTQSGIHERILKTGITPGGKPLVGFPEVSMAGSVPWGGFGSNCNPSLIQRDWDMFCNWHRGEFQYSEGIFADANQVMNLCLYSGQCETADEALRLYLEHEISADYIDELFKLCKWLEGTLPRQRVDPDGVDRTYPPPLHLPHIGESVAPDVKFMIHNPVHIKEAAALAVRLNTCVNDSWRWRLIYLRALIDEQLFDNGYIITPVCAGYFDELRRLYHAEQAYYCVAPPILGS